MYFVDSYLSTVTSRGCMHGEGGGVGAKDTPTCCEDGVHVLNEFKEIEEDKKHA